MRQCAHSGDANSTASAAATFAQNSATSSGTPCASTVHARQSVQNQCGNKCVQSWSKKGRRHDTTSKSTPGGRDAPATRSRPVLNDAFLQGVAYTVNKYSRSQRFKNKPERTADANELQRRGLRSSGRHSKATSGDKRRAVADPLQSNSRHTNWRSSSAKQRARHSWKSLDKSARRSFRENSARKHVFLEQRAKVLLDCALRVACESSCVAEFRSSVEWGGQHACDFNGAAAACATSRSGSSNGLNASGACFVETWSSSPQACGFVPHKGLQHCLIVSRPDDTRCGRQLPTTYTVLQVLERDGVVCGRHGRPAAA